jgi:predicted chitinase
MLSTIGKESGFIPKNEIPYTDTDNSRIRKIFGSRVKDLSDADLTKLKSNPSKFWDRVYGPDDPTGKSQQYGNTNPGDGEKYLGRGFNGITFKSGYAKYGKIVGIDLVSNPNQLNDPRIASKAAVAFFLNGIKAKGIDPNSFTNKRDAIRAFVQVNAGLGTNIEGSETLANAEKVSNNFTL